MLFLNVIVQADALDFLDDAFLHFRGLSDHVIKFLARFARRSSGRALSSSDMRQLQSPAPFGG